MFAGEQTAQSPTCHTSGVFVKRLHTLPGQDPGRAAPQPALRGIVVTSAETWPMSPISRLSALDAIAKADGIESLRQEALLKTGALQTAILTSENFSIIATDEKGIIQLFNVGAERMLGYMAAEVVNKLNPSDIHDPQEVMARAQALSLELATTITPGFEALAFKASRGIEDI